MNRRLLSIAVLLSFAGGYADSASYLLTSTFTGQLTGNVILLIIHCVENEWTNALSNAIAVATFLLGLALAEWMETGSGAPKDPRQLRLPLLLEMVLLLVAMSCRLRAGLLGNDLTIVFLCIGLGLQNGALRQYGKVMVHTTFITGTTTEFLTSLLQRRRGGENESKEEKHRSRILAGLLFAFIVGALAGAYFNYHFKVWGLAGIILPLSIALMAAWRD